MSDPSSAREALLIEAIGEAAMLIESVEALIPVLKENGREVARASSGLHDALAAFEGRMTAITENAKTQTVKHLVAHTEAAARRSVDQQSRAMADAARVAFGAQVGGVLERLQAMVRPLIERQEPPRRPWLTHAVTAAAASVATWVVVLCFGRG